MGTLRIESRAPVMFDDRRRAGLTLAGELADFVDRRVVVLGVPRGGVAVAAEVAKQLRGEMDVILAAKIGSPSNPEAAIGAVSEGGDVFLNDLMVSTLGVPQSYILRQRFRLEQRITRQSLAFRSVRPKLLLTGRTVIVTDDGAATGATMQAALLATRQEDPAQLIAALPVAPEETLNVLALHADQTVCLCAPPHFRTVQQFYRRFDQLADAELLELLLTGAHAQTGGNP